MEIGMSSRPRQAGRQGHCVR